MTHNNLIPIPADINKSVSPARQETMLATLGRPRETFSDEYQPVTNPRLSKHLATIDVGPFRATGLKPALNDLLQIFEEVLSKEPDLYHALRSDGMLCPRYVRGTKCISNHSWGTAIDVYFEGARDVRGDGQVLAGLAAIAPIFNAHGWYWGAAFGIEDGMHFEAGDARIREYASSGQLDFTTPVSLTDGLSQGDRGPEVRDLQHKLTEAGFATAVDGIFGPLTRAVLVEFQARNALRPTGVADPDTLGALNHVLTPPSPSDVLASTALLIPGATGSQVSDWQGFLRSLGLLADSGFAPGVFDSSTVVATRLFQEQHGLAPDGVVGPKTRSAASGTGSDDTATRSTNRLRRLSNQELTADIIHQAPQLLLSHFRDPIGTTIPFTSDGRQLVGVLEWHFNQRQGKHKGFSVFVPMQA